jgi:hypothetical protein
MLFYEKFSELAKTTSNQGIAAPALFKLTRNFRSHQGIIALSSFVMRLLVKGISALIEKYRISTSSIRLTSHSAFPQTVDKMDEETSKCGGPKPALFSTYPCFRRSWWIIHPVN